MLKPPTRRGDGDGLIHDPFADVEVGVDPFLDVFVVRYLVGVETGAGAQMGVVSPVVSGVCGVERERERRERGGRGGSCVLRVVCCVWCVDAGRGREYGNTHVKPVDLFIPARIVETTPG